MFLPRNDLDEINWGRYSSGGQSSSRYVDMVIKQKSNDDEIKFTNIQREETSVLNEYVHNVLIPAMKRDIKKSSKDESSTEDETASDEDPVATEATDDTDDDSDDDENFVDAEDDDSEEEDEDNDEYSDESDDESGGIPVVADEFAMELVKERGDDYSSESEDEGQRVSKRLRT